MYIALISKKLVYVSSLPFYFVFDKIMNTVTESEVDYANVPPGLMSLLEEFTVSVLREKPDNLVDFAVDYFLDMQKSAGMAEKKTISFEAYTATGSEEEPMHTVTDDEDDDEPMERKHDISSVQCERSWDNLCHSCTEISPKGQVSNCVHFEMCFFYFDTCR